MATESDNVNSGALGTLLAVGLFAVIGIAFVVTALVRAETADELEKKEISADRPYRDLVAEQGAKMSAPAAYVDRGRGVVSLPIERAMEVVVADLKKDPNSATPPPSAGGTGGSGGGSPTASGGGTGGSGGSGGTSAAAGGAGGAGGVAAGGAENKPADEAVHAEKGKEKGGTKPHATPGAVSSAPAPAIPAPPPVPASPSPNEK